MPDEVSTGLIVAGIATLVFGFAAGVLWLAERFLPSKEAKADASPLMRLWTEHKLLCICIVVVAGSLLYTLPSTVELYHTEGARILFYPAGMAYVLVSLIREARARLVPDELRAILAKANVLEKTDPAAALDLLDSFFVARHEAATQQRALLWESASHDRRAAVRLERLLKDELRGHDLMRRRGVAAAPPEQQAVGLEMVEKAERRTRDDLERVRAILKQLKP